jgi:hypothetical protein
MAIFKFFVAICSDKTLAKPCFITIQFEDSKQNTINLEDLFFS